MNALVRSVAAACALSLPYATARANDTGATIARGAVTCGDVAGPALTPRRFVFPRDDGAHDDFTTETWRTFGRVSDLAGNPYDLSVTVSRYAIAGCGIASHENRWTAARIVTGAFTMLDETTGQRSHGEYVEREGPLGAKAGRGHLSLTIAGLRAGETASGATGSPAFTIAMHDGGRTTIDLVERARGGAVALGPNGVAATGSCAACEAYAYAYTRNRTRGTLTIAGTSRAVAGTAWFEHEFARSELGPQDAGWDRFSLTFDDGGAFDGRFTRAFGDGIVAVSGVWVDARGRVRYLSAGTDSEAEYPPDTTWRSEASATTYPSAWLLDGLEVNELARDQEVFTRGRVPYVMGAIDAVPQSGDGGTGHGFVELTGYPATVAP